MILKFCFLSLLLTSSCMYNFMYMYKECVSIQNIYIYITIIHYIDTKCHEHILSIKLFQFYFWPTVFLHQLTW